MRIIALTLATAVAIAGCVQMSGAGTQVRFNEAEIRDAERALERALESTDPTAWVYAYTEDAVFVAPGAPAVQGRAALLQMALAMKPLSSAAIKALRTEGSGNLAYVVELTPNAYPFHSDNPACASNWYERSRAA